MIFKWLLLIAIIGIVFLGAVFEHKDKDIKICIVILGGVLATAVLGSYLFTILNPHLPYPVESNSNDDVSKDGNQPDVEEESIPEENETIVSYTSQPAVSYTSDSATSDNQEATKYMLDITGKTTLSGRIAYESQKDQYKYTAPVNGTYRFDTDLSAGSSVTVQIDGENGNYIKNGRNSLTIDLEAGQTYILSIEHYDGICDYTVSIGVPIEIEDITNQTTIVGKITYKDQKNKYLYTAPTTGTYRFDTDLSAGSSVTVQIDGENGNYIKNGRNSLTIDLEAGQTYILSIEHYDGICDYTVSIGVPIEIEDITNQTTIVGKITYKDQKNKYLYTAPTTGTYRFDTDLSAGSSVTVQIDGENGNYIKNGRNSLTIDLEARQTYILSIEHYDGICDYTINIGVPAETIDIT